MPTFEKGILFGLSAEFQQNRLLLLAAVQNRLSPLAFGQIDCCNQNEIRWGFDKSGQATYKQLGLKPAQFFSRKGETSLECASLLIVIGICM